MKNPQTIDEWHEAVDGAHVMLLIDSARQYGLITGGPIANVDRCLELLEIGRKIGIEPRADAVQRLMMQLAGAD